jgi:hypothetical protein
MNIDDMMSEIAVSLRDVINETPEKVDEAPEEFYNDLACRLVLKLARHRLTIVPALSASTGDAAVRILDIFNGWLKDHPERHYITRFDTSGKFEIVLRVDGQVKGFLQGDAIQDAYGQAAQVISFNGGSIDEEQSSSRA